MRVAAGHSLGGALALLAAFDLQRLHPQATATVYTFGAPRVRGSFLVVVVVVVVVVAVWVWVGAPAPFRQPAVCCRAGAAEGMPAVHAPFQALRTGAHKVWRRHTHCSARQ